MDKAGTAGTLPSSRCSVAALWNVARQRSSSVFNTESSAARASSSVSALLTECSIVGRRFAGWGRTGQSGNGAVAQSLIDQQQQYTPPLWWFFLCRGRR
jgi:hypothetical protein